MTDSTINGGSGEGNLDFGTSAEELFGEFEDESLEDEELERSERGKPDDIEDRTAADVFDQLKSETEAVDTVSVLEDETPEDIIASADEPDDGDEPDDDLIEDEAALETLLLTGRTKGEEFLWVDTGDSTAEAGATPGVSDPEPDRGDPGTITNEGDSVSFDEDDISTDFDGVPPDEEGTPDPTDEERTPEATDDGPIADEPTDLVAVDSEDTDLVPEEDSEESSGGILAWIRSKLPF